MLVVEEHDGAAGLHVEGARGVQDGVLNNVHDAVFRNDGFGFDLHDGAADDGGVEERLGSAFGHGGGDGGGWGERGWKGGFPIGVEEVGEDVDEGRGGGGEPGEDWHTAETCVWEESSKRI